MAVHVRGSLKRFYAAHALAGRNAKYTTLSICAIHTYRRGELIRTGVKVAIVGRPNAGKSSLLNALAARDAAIVSSTPGTTRDTVEVAVDLAGQKVQPAQGPFLVTLGRAPMISSCCRNMTCHVLMSSMLCLPTCYCTAQATSSQRQCLVV